MRRMYSEKQIKNLIEEDLSNVVATKGQYTGSVTIKMTKVGHCTTIAGFFSVNNTSGEVADLDVLTISIPLAENVDGNEFSLIQAHESAKSFASGYITQYPDSIVLSIYKAPTGVSTYYLDVDIIDNEPLPVEDYPGE